MDGEPAGRSRLPGERGIPEDERLAVGRPVNVSLSRRQFAALLRPDREQPLTILARNRSQKVQRSISQLHRLLTALPQPASLLAHGPDIGPAVARRLEQEILPIRRPRAATFVVWIVPPRKQRMKICSVGREFPK